MDISHPESSFDALGLDSSTRSFAHSPQDSADNRENDFTGTLIASGSFEYENSAETRSSIVESMVRPIDWALGHLRGYKGREPKKNCDFCNPNKIRTEIVQEVEIRKELVA